MDCIGLNCKGSNGFISQSGKRPEERIIHCAAVLLTRATYHEGSRTFCHTFVIHLLNHCLIRLICLVVFSNPFVISEIILAHREPQSFSLGTKCYTHYLMSP